MRDLRFAAALFDLDDTLHDDTQTYRRAAERTAADGAATRGLDPVVLFDAYVTRADEFWTALSRDTLRTPLVALREAMWTSALAACGVDDPALGVQLAANYNRYRAGFLTLWPGVAEMLGRLRVAGLKLGIVTNGFSETHREKISVLGLTDVVDGLFIADEIGTVKPDPRFFTHAAEELGVAPGDCAVVGDRYDRDVRGAHAAGMYAIWLDVRADTIPAGERPPDAVARRITDVEPFLLERAA